MHGQFLIRCTGCLHCILNEHTIFDGPSFLFAHRPDIKPCRNDDEHHRKCRKNVKIHRNHVDECLERCHCNEPTGCEKRCNQPHDPRTPACNRCDYRYGRGGCINEIGKLRPRHLVFISQRLCYLTDDQGTEIVIDEDDDAEKTCGKVRLPSRSHFSERPAVNAFAPPDICMTAVRMPRKYRKMMMNAFHVMIAPSTTKIIANDSHTIRTIPPIPPSAIRKAEVMMPRPRLSPTLRVATTSSSVSSGGTSDMYSQFNIVSIYLPPLNFPTIKDATAALQNQPL